MASTRAGSAASHAEGRCPKRMVYGPCGGVRADGSCEMRPGPCTFPEPVLRTDAISAVDVPSVPLVLTDFTAPAFDADALLRVGEILVPSCSAVLVGEHQNRPDFPPVLTAQLLRDCGARPWITLACRDRNRIVLEQELRGLKFVGVDTVLCVTGDGRGYDVRSDVTQVFDLDGPRLAELATTIGLSAAVPETPLAPPTALRAKRLVAKQASGAAVGVLNHVARPDDVRAFMSDARAAGLTMPVIAAVAVYTDEYSIAILEGLPGLDLDLDAAGAVLRSPDPVSAGIRAAVDEALELLDIDGIVGVNLSGSASGLGWEYAARVKAEVGHSVLAATGT